MSSDSEGNDLRDVVIRALIRREYADESGTPRSPIFDTVTSGASVTIGTDGSIRQVVLGYAEVPPRTHIGRHQDFDSFQQAIEGVAHYVHWKSETEPPATPLS